MGCSHISVWSDRETRPTHPCRPTWVPGRTRGGRGEAGGGDLLHGQAADHVITSLYYLILSHEQPGAAAGARPGSKSDGDRGSSFADGCAHAGGESRFL